MGDACPRDDAPRSEGDAAGAASTTAPPPERGQRASLTGELLEERFEVMELLGEGGMARVYRAFDHQGGEEVAIKVLRKRGADDPVVRRRFFNEARAMMGMMSRHVVEILALGPVDAERPYFVMELLEGRCLDELCGEPLPFDLVYDYARQIAAALSVAHGRGIVHRDIKPENVFIVSEDGQELCKVIDFGIAKHETVIGMTVTGAIFGTPHYMAPEQAAGRDRISPRTDVYALGIVLYELIAGELPFDGLDSMQVMLAQIGMPPRSLREWRPDCPPELDALVMRCLEKRPEDRFADALELHAALDAIAGDAPTAAEPRVTLEEVSGLRLRADVAEAQAPPRPTPTDPIPWIAPEREPAAETVTPRSSLRFHAVLTLALLMAIALTLLAAHAVSV